MAADSMPIPNLMDPHEGHKTVSPVLFVLPGTDIEVSLARAEPNEKYPDLQSRDFMVYFRHKGQTFPNVGYIHIDTVKGEATYEVSGIKV